MSLLAATVRVPRDHPAFEGHFPGHPILPGAVLLSEALARAAAACGAAPQSFVLVQCKFLRPVAPGASLTFSCEEEAAGTLRFEFRDATGPVAGGAFARKDP